MTPTPADVARTILTNPMVIVALVEMAVPLSGLSIPTLVDVKAQRSGGCRPARSRSSRSSPRESTPPSGLPDSTSWRVTSTGGMPTAQNAFSAATRAGAGVKIAQGTVLVSTFASLLATVLTAWLFHLFALM